MRVLGWACVVAFGLSHVLLTPEPDEAKPVEVARSRTAVRFDFAGGSFADVDGRIVLDTVAMAGGGLTLLSRRDGWAVGFPSACDLPPAACPRAILESDPQPWLNPGRRPVRWGASVRMTAGQVSEGSNVVQKGSSASGTQFKLQVDGRTARPSCVVAGQIGGAHRIFVAVATGGIADGRWHNLLCERKAQTLRLVIDGRRVAETSVPEALSIVNDRPLRIGGKGVGPYNDQFHGTLDDVFVEIG